MLLKYEKFQMIFIFLVLLLLRNVRIIGKQRNPQKYIKKKTKLHLFSVLFHHDYVLVNQIYNIYLFYLKNNMEK
jgi:hypothetical protein